jgi:hypothetical protein
MDGEVGIPLKRMSAFEFLDGAKRANPSPPSYTI